MRKSGKAKVFQSTLPMRGATGGGCKNRAHTAISIHAPHEGSDQVQVAAHCCLEDFNPRSP